MIPGQELKLNLHRHCIELIEAKVAGLQELLAGLAESVANETKSTAGDKYETARAMLHIEQDHVRRQVRESNAQLAMLRSIDPCRQTPFIGPGSLVRLNSEWYFLSTSLGKLHLDGLTIIALSEESPLGARLRGLAAGAEVTQNGRSFRIEEVL